MRKTVDLPPGQDRKIRQRIRVRTSRKSRRARRRIGVLVLLLGVLGALAALTIIPLLSARARLDEARSQAEGAMSALVSGDAAGARTGFFAAEDAFLRAQDQAENPLLRAVGFLPVLGRTPDAVGDMAEAGAFLARAGKVLAEALAELPGGTAALAPERGAIPVEPLRKLAPGLDEARSLVLDAQAVMEGSPTRALLGPVGAGQARLMAELDQAERAVTAAAAMARSLPDFLGGDGPRRYFVAAQNPAELRGTGGFIGSYAILTARGGRLELSDFKPIETLPDADVSEVEPPNPSFAARYNTYGGAGFWRQINRTADFPSAAVAMERLYEVVRGTPLDGAIAADPFALQALLGTGEVGVPGTDRVLDSGSMVGFLTNEAYAVFPDSTTRKRILGDVAGAVFDRFLRGGSTAPAAAARSLIGVAADGHLLLHSIHPEEQRGFVDAGIHGGLGGGTGDFLGVTANNNAGNKIDFYAQRTIRYDVRLGAEGSGVGLATVELANQAPLEGQPRYVIGPYSEAFEAGENVTVMDVYCARSCGLDGVTLDGRPFEAGSERELGHAVYPVRLEVPSGSSATVELRLLLSRAWEGDDGAGTYRLSFRGQPTIRPTRLSIEVQVPEGMEVVRASPGIQVEGGRAVWTGLAEDHMTFEIEFQRPLLERMWRSIVRFLGRPVFQVGALGLPVVVTRRRTI